MCFPLLQPAPGRITADQLKEYKDPAQGGSEVRGHWRVHIDHKEGCKPEYVNCKYCFLRLKHDSSTGGLSRHLDKCSAAPAEARSLRSS